jgi:hypothetical protein
MSLTVDLHQHVIPDFYWEASNEDGNDAGGITPPRRSLDGAIAYLDEARIDVAVPSISTPGVHFGDDAAARILARQVNELRFVGLLLRRAARDSRRTADRPARPCPIEMTATACSRPLIRHWYARRLRLERP